MALPQVGGIITGRHSNSSAVIDISAIPTGAWILISAMSSASSLVITAPTGWAVLEDHIITGSRNNYLFGKMKDADDPASIQFTHTSTVSVAYGLIWGTGGSDISSWVVGTPQRRTDSTDPAGSRYTNVAPGITTENSDCLVIGISNEATLAMTQSNEVVSYSPAGEWTERMWLPQVAPSDRLETIWMATKEMPTAGSTGNLSVTYISPQDSNGWALQVAIPSTESIPIEKPTIVGVPITYTGSSNSTFTIARPSGAMDNDYVVVAVRGQTSSLSEDLSSAGFSRLGPAAVYGNAGWRLIGLFGRPIASIDAEPSNYTFTFTAGATGTRLVATAFLVRGVDTANPVAGYYDAYGGIDNTTNGRQTPVYSINGVPGLQLFIAGSEFGANAPHVPVNEPAGFTIVQEVVTTTDIAASRSYLYVAARDAFSAQSMPAAIKWTTGSGVSAQSITLRGVNAVATDPASVGYSLVNGEGDEVTAFYTIEGDELRTPTNVIPMRRGFQSVAEMLATPGFTWAHRGGSLSYPEMSLYAYTQSVARGYGVLEVSLARTSDGVWFGLHDQTTDRTSAGVYGDASAQTWAQIQAQNIVVGSTGAPQPYMRWEEIVEAYGQTHLFVVDPKYAVGAHRTEFLNIVKQSVGTERAIIKYSGVGSGAANLSNAAKAQGFETWGFFYAGDASATQGGNGALQTWGPSWTLIGMDYNASQAIWDEALALGKPVIAHIVPNQAAYNTAIAKGANGAQVSGVAVVEPVSWWTQ